MKVLVNKTLPGCCLSMLLLVICVTLAFFPAAAAAQTGADSGSGQVRGKVSAGLEHSALINYDGYVYFWGDNSYGQLGIPDLEYSDEPLRLYLPAKAIDISLGSYHSLVLLENGDVYAFGRNSFGQLGNGTTDQSYIPVKIEELPLIKSISAGAFHSLALAEDGSVWAWGNNTQMQVGDVFSEAILDDDGNILGSRCTSPVRIPASDAAGVEAGGQHSLYLDTKGNVYTWGDNSRGQLGNGSTQKSGRPSLVSGLENVRLIAAGYMHSLAVSRIEGRDTLWAWGDDTHGQLGIGSDLVAGLYRSLPVRCEPLEGYEAISPFIDQITAGYTHSAAAVFLTSDPGGLNLDRQQFWFWGNNNYGQLGNGSSGNNIIRPLLHSGVYFDHPGSHFLPLDSLAAGGYHTLLLSSKGLLAASGRGDKGQLGNISVLDRKQFTNVAIPDVIYPGFIPGSSLNIDQVSETEYLLRWPEARDNIAVTGYKIKINASDGSVVNMEIQNQEYAELTEMDPDLAYEIVVIPHDSESSKIEWQKLSRLVAYILPEGKTDVDTYFAAPMESIYLAMPYTHNWLPGNTGNIMPLDVPWDTSRIYGDKAVKPPGNYLPVLITAGITMVLLIIILAAYNRRNPLTVREPDIALTVDTGSEQDTGRQQ